MTKLSKTLAFGFLLAAILPATQAVAQIPGGLTPLPDPKGPDFGVSLDYALQTERIRHSNVVIYLDELQRNEDAEIQIEELKCKTGACVKALAEKERDQHRDIQAARIHENALNANFVARITAYYRTNRSYGTRREL
jgi:hypothetical protein